MMSEYQKRLILLRPTDVRQTNLSGYARLEMRPGRGSIAFHVQGLDGDGRTAAVLIGPGGNSVQVLGNINTDGKGGGDARFDLSGPLSIAWADASAIAIATTGKERARFALTSVLDQNIWLDWTQAAQAAAKSLGIQSAVPVAAAPVQEPIVAAQSVQQPELAVAPIEEEPLLDSVSIEEEVLLQEVAPAQEASIEPTQQETEVEAINSEEAAIPEEPIEPAAVDAEPILEEPLQQDVPDQQTFEETPTPQLVQQEEQSIEENKAITQQEEPLQEQSTKLLDWELLDWPSQLDELFDLFKRHTVIKGEEEGIYYARIPIKGQNLGIDHHLMGIRAIEGQAQGVCIALPGEYAELPPPGLEGYTHKTIDDQGYWVLWQDKK